MSGASTSDSNWSCAIVAKGTDARATPVLVSRRFPLEIGQGNGGPVSQSCTALFVSGFAGAVTMSFAERLVIGLVILGLVLGIILLWLVSSPTGPCEDLGDWAKPLCKHVTWPGGELFNFPMRRSRPSIGASAASAR